LATDTRGTSTSYTYDNLDRLAASTTAGATVSYAYNPTTDRLQSVPRNNTTYTLATYTYGAANGDLLSSTYGNGAQVSYTYDAYHRPTGVQWQGDSPSTVVYDARGDVYKSTDGITGVTTTYEYDLIGRPLAVSSSDDLKQWVGYDTYGYTTSVNWSQGSVSQKMTYTYNNANLKDLLTGVSVTGTTPAYDAIGNPVSWRSSMSMSWVRGRRLSTITAPGQAYSYSYNDSGVRTSKTVNGTTTTFTLAGTRILKQTSGNTTIEFIYDEAGQAIGFKTGGATYYCVFNLQGDVIGIVTSAGTQVVTYTYDAWGRPLSTTGSQASTIGAQNPLRYRGYYYDTETGFYYLNSRYYDPVVGRFVNEDGMLSTGLGYDGMNMFVYCLNSPVNRSDYSGHNSTSFIEVIGKAINYTLNTTGQALTYLAITANSAAYTVAVSVATTVRSESFANSIVRNSVTLEYYETPTDPAVGKISLSVTQALPNSGKPGLFYLFHDIKSKYGDFEDTYGVGINIKEFVVLEIGWLSTYDLAVSLQLTPESYVGAQVGMSGIGMTVGSIQGNTTYEATMVVGWATIELVIELILIAEGFAESIPQGNEVPDFRIPPFPERSRVPAPVR